MRVTLKQVADELGLSISTVSHVLNGNGFAYNKATRKLIIDAADRLGYVPNASARAMRTGKFGTVALIMSNDPNRSMLFQGMATGICEQLEREGYHLILSILPDEQLTDPDFIPHIMRTWMVDGVLVAYFSNIPRRFEALLKEHKVPSIWLNRRARYDSVLSDDEQAIKAMIKHLQELGHRHIAFSEFTGMSRVKNTAMSIRFKAFEKESQRLGLTFTRWGETAYTPRKERPERCLAYLQAKDRPTAVIALSPSNAIPVQDAALTLGMKIPEELSIVTFADNRTDDSGVEMASMMVPMEEIGTTAAAMLFEKIRSPEQPLVSRRIKLAYHPGDTVGPVACPESSL